MYGKVKWMAISERVNFFFHSQMTIGALKSLEEITFKSKVLWIILLCQKDCFTLSGIEPECQKNAPKCYSTTDILHTEKCFI